MQTELINVGVFLDVVIDHNKNEIELIYFRSCKIHEVQKALVDLSHRGDWDKISQYRFKAEY